MTGLLHLEAHPCGAEKLIIDRLPASSKHSVEAGAENYPEGEVVDDLGKVREILYKLQRPGIAPDLVYAHDWKEQDL